MKKLTITIFALTLVSLGFSQSLKVNAEDTINVVGASVDFELIAEIDIENISDEQKSVDVKRTVLTSPTVFSNYFCWSACYLPSIDTSLSPINVGAYDVNSAFSGHIRPNGTTGIAKILYTFFDSNNPTDSASVLVIYNVTAVGIEDFNKGTLISSFPNPASNSINISYNSLNFYPGASILIYDIAGKEVCNAPLDLNLNNEVVNIASLQNGVYFYSLTNCKRNIERKKFIVQH